MDLLLRTGMRRRIIGLRRARNDARVRQVQGPRQATAASAIAGQFRCCGPGLVTDQEAVHG
jgi:hypothetical protein